MKSFLKYTFDSLTLVWFCVITAANAIAITACRYYYYLHFAKGLVVVYSIFCGLFLLINFFRWLQYKNF